MLYGGTIMGAAVAVGTGLQIYGQYESGRAAKKAARFNARIARKNLKIAKEQAQDIVEGGAISAERLKRDALKFADDQLLAFAGQNIDVSSQVATQAVEDTARIAAADIITLQHEVAQQVWATKVGAQDIAAQAALDRMIARRAERSANIKIASTLILAGGKL
jgi:hypothetical protein